MCCFCASGQQWEEPTHKDDSIAASTDHNMSYNQTKGRELGMLHLHDMHENHMMLGSEV